MIRKLAFALSLLGVCLTGFVHALGLGEVTVKSSLNQPLIAEIGLVNSSELGVNEILPGLATREEFLKANVDRGYFLSDISANGDKVLISNVEDIKSGTNGVKYSLQSYDFSSLTYSMEKSALGMNGSAEFGSAIFMGNAGLNNKHQLVYSDYVLKVDEFQPVVQLGNLDTVTLVGSGELVSEKFDSILIRESSSKLSQWSAEEGYKSFNTIFSEDSLYANADFGEGMFYIENSDVYKFDYLSEEITLVESNVGDRSLGLLISAIGGGSVVYSQNENESGILNIILEDTTTGVKAVIDEVEVEHLASGVPIRGNFSDDNRYLMIQYFIEENGSSRSNIVIFDLITNEKLINYGHDKKIALRAILSGNGKKLAITRVDDDFDWEKFGIMMSKDKK